MKQREFAKYLHVAVKTFGDFWAINAAQAPEGETWPDEMSEADWHEQFIMWLGSWEDGHCKKCGGVMGYAPDLVNVLECPKCDF